MRTQFGSVTRDSDICVICGQRSATTKEHIPPKGIFLERPEQFLTVPSCPQCNHDTKLDDEYFRQVLSAASFTDEGQAVWKQKVAVKFPETPATQAGLRSQLIRFPVDAPGLGSVEVPALLAKANRINTVVDKMVRGLYWFHSANLLPPEIPVQVGMLNVTELAEYFDDPERLRVFRKAQLGLYRDPEVMRTFFYNGAIGPEGSMWYLFFYRQNALIAWTLHPKSAPAAT